MAALARQHRVSLWDLIEQARRRSSGWAPVTLARAGGPAAPAAGSFTLPEICRLREGDPAVQERYVSQFWPEVEREAGHYARRGGDRDDLTGEGALALWEAAFHYDPRKHRTDFAGYVRNTVHRRVRRAYRRQMGFDRPVERLQPQPGAAEAPAAGPGAGTEAVEQRLDLAGALRSLAPEQRAELGEYLAAVAAEGLAPEEAARRLASRHGRTPAAAKKRIQRARRRVADWLSAV